jgi:hypothetical protein
MAFDDNNYSKDFTISDKRMIISLLLNQPDQIEITKIMNTGKYSIDNTHITLDWYGNIYHNGIAMSTKTVKLEFICNLEKIIIKINDLTNSTSKQSLRKMNSLYYCTLMKTVGIKLQKILTLINLHQIELNFSWFNYKLYQNTENPKFYIIEKSYKMFGYNLIIPEYIIIFDNYLCIDH